MINMCPADERVLSQEILAPCLMKVPKSNTAKWSDAIAKIAFELSAKFGMEVTDLAFDIAAIIWREGSNGDPNCLGDLGHGHGLMQIDDRSHQAFLAKKDSSGKYLWQIPEENIRYGILYVYGPAYVHYKGNRKNALCSYNGGMGRVDQALRDGKDPDLVTSASYGSKTGDYGSDTLRRREQLMNAA